MSLTYAELFAGAGGLSMGLELAGWEAVAHAEIEPHARAVLRKHWPDCRLDGDVSQVNGADYAGVTLLSGGSPCQDLSVAGKRAGMTEGSGTRSSLYFEQVRIWLESGAPYFLWENVLGALSSNNGRDFAAVLSALVGAPIAVPSDGWQSAGVAAGPTGVAAWRVLDCQYFGPPQRRRRVFVLGARAGGVDPAEVLAVSESLRGDTAPRRETGQGVAADAGGGAAGAVGIGGTVAHALTGEGRDASEDGTGRGTPVVVALNNDSRAAASNAAAPLRGGGRAQQSVVAFHPTQDPISGAKSSALGTTSGGMGVLAFDTYNQTLDKVDATLSSGESGRPSVVTYDARRNGDGAVVNTMAGDHQNRVTDYTAIVLRNREGKPGGGKGPLLSAERERTIGTGNDQVLFTGPVVAPTFAAGAHPGGANGQDAPQVAAAILAAAPSSGIPRRLMPVETERLMGWGDQWTALGIDEDGREYALSDTARYRLCGNGVASPVAAWIAWRLRWALLGA